MIPSVLASQLIRGVQDFLTTTFHATTPAFQNIMENFVEQENNLYKGPYVSIALPFKTGESKQKYFPDILNASFIPYYHQELAFKRLGDPQPKSTLVATGTGSGKTESFMIPMLDYCRANKEQRGIKAIVIYPMNALATDQAKRFAKEIANAEALHGLRVGLFIGSKESAPNTHMTNDYVITDKNVLRQDPPDILLTNYKMLDFMLMRPRDQKLWEQNIGTGVLRFIAVDEIHTFDGAQGSDLASLLRRLRAKLEIKEGELACIGTSATLGSGSTQPIRDFASTVFNETFDEESVITEHRIDAKTFFADVEDELFNFPGPNNIDALQYQNYTSKEEYIQAQFNLWFFDEVKDVNDVPFRRDLGNRLKKLSLFKLLLNSLDGKVVSQKQLIEEIARRISLGKANQQYYTALLDSLVALTSWARSTDGKRPFLHIRVQLWLRELTRMVGSLGNQPVIRYSHDIPSREPIKHYPIIHCRDCHAMGWGGVKKERTGIVLGDLEPFYQAFFSRDPRLTFMFPVDDDFQSKSGRIYFIDPLSGEEIFDKAEESKGVLTYEPDNLTQHHRSHNNCPFCGNKNSLTILGSRAASLTSVLIGQSFNSSYNEDKKLIAFSDSVQDAAHRAGFFGARSFQFTLRSVIQQALEKHDGDVNIAQFSSKVATYWKQRLGNDAEYVATMIAPDMEWVRDYDDLRKTGELSAKSDIVNIIDKRLDWMIYSEYGYKSNIGRTLERAGASVAYVDNFSGVVDDVLHLLKNDVEMLRDITYAQINKFILGFLLHLKKQGAIESDHLGMYINSGGNIFAFTKYQQIYMPSFTKRSRSPMFLTNGNIQDFEKIVQQNNNTWCQQWLSSNFMDDALLIGGYAAVVYETVIGKLLKYNILKEHDVKGDRVWSINPEKLFVTKEVASLLCDQCGDVLQVKSSQYADAIEMCCLRKGCQGHYEKADERDDYYRKLYAHGDVQRIVADEHTGLLTRDQREQVERGFIGRLSNEPWKPNLLSATPTLEMGIDIGDLSTVMLCSVPPNGANYLQRIGRAGRTDGNAFTATVANGKDHDLYFYEDPDAMMQGSIEAPGVFIDASAILQRQFMAFSIDQWVTHKQIDEADFPHKLSAVLDAVAKKSEEKFPYTLIHYIQNNVQSLLQSFFALYSNTLQEMTKDQLKLFAKGKDEEVRLSHEPDELKESMSLAYKILNRLEQVVKERNSLQQRIEALRKRRKAHIAKEAQDKDHEEVLRELESELAGLKSVLLKIKQRETLEFFTNEGLLPNYAFPESGVVLKSVIYRQRKTQQADEGGKFESDTYEYERSGSSAISELAPLNSFYATGRKVVVDQIDMNVSSVESWRFCDKCSHMELDSGEVTVRCPKCDSDMWSDAGQRRDLLRLKQVLANTSDRKSRIKDDSEQRDPLFYTKQLMINFDKKQIQDAYAVESQDTPFGFEYIQKVHFR